MTLGIFETPDWKKDMEASITASNLLEKFPHLQKLLKLKQKDIHQIDEIYPIKITPHYASLIDWGNAKDPLLKIVLPNKAELSATGLGDQSGEILNSRKTCIPGLQHKYSSTALLLINGTCASYCRFCFRRRFVGTQKEVVNDLDGAFDYISHHPEINNVLLSGGDSFLASNQRIEYILRRLREIPHVSSIRFGTKLGVYLPSRFEDDGLMGILKKYSYNDKRIYVVSHIDHPRELDKKSVSAHAKLINSGIPVLSQTVFAKGVNDNANVLSELFNRIASIGIRPYYLFQCRPVKGATHYHIPFLDGFRIVEQAKKKLSGLGKTFRYMMSHASGKMEILSVSLEDLDRVAVFKYHQARDSKYLGEIISLAYRYPSHWLDDIFTQSDCRVISGLPAAEYAKQQSALL
ncbi:MAG: KamA family radical SAM protein [Candidatus Micrarchaeia archaeon]|jgi:KamA family protein